MLLDGFAFQRDPLTFLRSLDTAPPVLRFKAGPAAFSLVLAPELIHRVLVSDRHRFGEGKWTRRGRFMLGDCLITREGEPHRIRRQLMQPLFARKRLEAKSQELVTTIGHWAARRSDGEVDDCHSLMADVAALSACQALCDYDLSKSRQPVRRVSEAVEIMVRAIPRLPLMVPQALLARRRLRQVAAEMKHGELAIALRDGGCREADIAREIVSILVAGIDTTPRTLSRLWLEVSRDPILERRLHDEVDGALVGGSGGEDLGPERLQNLEFLQSLILETQRLYPAVRFVDRRPLEDLELGGALLQKDCNLLICPLLAHRDPEVYEAPDEFRPDRWSNGTRPSPLSFFPFGIGAHRCIGEWIARITLPAIVVHLARRFRVIMDEPERAINDEVTHVPVQLKLRVPDAGAGSVG